MIWTPVKEMSPHRPDHMEAASEVGTFIAGPRKSDGCWEFLPPDDDWQGVGENWNEPECLDAAERWLAEQTE